ncbi:MAG TPA: hypothetical protein VGK84_08050 [Candidatus Tumulicola sp.]|jgi:hypothetical protein
MTYDSSDELDRALFALPLEEPPSELRGSILTATAYRPAPPFSAWEAIGLGVISAVTVWLLAVVAMGGAPLFFTTLGTIGRFTADGLSNMYALAWLGAGVATALWLSLFTSSQSISLLRQRFDAQRGR